MAAPAVGAAIAVGAEIMSMLLKIASSDEGVAWIGRHLKDKRPALRARIRANRHVKVGGKEV
jgi:hypothetical protein